VGDQEPPEEDLTVTITDARTRLGEVVNRARYSGRPVRLTSHGKTAAWIISDEVMERLRRLEDDRDLAELAVLTADAGGEWIPHQDVAATLGKPAA